jgi:hypothetical protein
LGWAFHPRRAIPHKFPRKPSITTADQKTHDRLSACLEKDVANGREWRGPVETAVFFISGPASTNPETL